MRFALLFAIIPVLFAETKTEKQLRAQVAELQQSLRAAAHDTAEVKSVAEKKTLDLLRENAQLSSQVRFLSVHVDSLTAERDSLKTQLHGQSEITKFQTKVITAIPKQVPLPLVVDTISKVAPKIESKIDRNHKESKETLDKILDATAKIETTTDALNAAATKIAAIQARNSERSKQVAHWQEQAAQIVHSLFWIGIGIVLLFLLIAISMIMVFTHADRRPRCAVDQGLPHEAPHDLSFGR